jgi:creatinine amidohydrolase
MDDRTMYYANLAWPDIESRLRASRPTVLLLPVGATEPHGPHAPLATDMLISDGICRRVVRALADDPVMDALILPPIAYGVTRYAQSFPGPVHVSEDALHALLVEVCASLIAQGFRHIMLVNNHFEPEHVATLHRSIDTVLAKTGTQIGFLDLTRRERAAELTEEFRKAECHGGRYETSLVLADHAELVDTAAARALPYVPVNLAQVIRDGLKDFRAMGLAAAYNGAPAEATAAEGHESFAILTRMTIALMRELVRGTGGRDRPGMYTRV